ncbi:MULTISPECIES: AzlC family ABC transporter permease [unclassified Modicisalibacter]|uniref:AzlC family ABC transporter permease n=1 Tax=unclassified Modicisalibacter TaxID=2679913 RepID=UPI001CCE4F3D|nr:MULTISPECIES: AzlC family ABC transporter permease [unclassified Modicisalibacter]MBZ9557749.1 AzlC family ABC transporter permease [Modicisalibacter sp. R2A 31.J]MBZ9573587.1 AzlC family ABC transporter permease [Modicisalibacter sp. MOD 31.J]
MNDARLHDPSPAWRAGLREALPLLGGYVPVAVSFGLVAVQAGFSTWEVVAISTLIYAGASQFLFVGMAAGGAPLWLTVALTLLINVRHLVYAPNLAPWMTASRWWPWLMHGLTDQIFALAHTRLPQMPPERRLGWFAGAAGLAWLSWIAGSLLGAVAGEWLTRRWPLLGEVMPFALPALFLVLLAPRFTSPRWSLALGVSVAAALAFSLGGYTNVSIPLAALCGALCFQLAGQPRRPGAGGGA